MFKIEKPIIDNIVNIKYDNISDKTKLEQYDIKNEIINIISSEINSCSFDSVTFKEQVLNNIYVSDTIFINCDLSNIKFINSSFYRVEFINCKLFGTNFIDSSLSNITINDCMCYYLNMAGNKIKEIQILNSNLKESSFTSNKFTNIIMTNVDLKDSEISNTSLKDIDLSNSNIEGIKTDISNIKGAIINSYQTMDLISLLGVKIK